jgi:hypothetical protein
MPNFATGTGTGTGAVTSSYGPGDNLDDEMTFAQLGADFRPGSRTQQQQLLFPAVLASPEPDVDGVRGSARVLVADTPQRR